VTATVETSLGKKASRGAAVTLAGQIIRITVQLLGIVLLARLLSPSDYGVTAMVLAIIGVGEILRDFGLSSAAIQAKTLTRGQRANLFWINVGIGLALTIIVAALAQPIAAFYGDDRLVLVTLVLSCTFFLNGFSTQFRADLNRHFRFGQLAAVEVGAQVAALGIALALAAMGWGYWAIVAQQVLQVLFQAIALPAMAGWWPSLPSRGEEMRPFLKFGGGLVGAQLLNYASRNVDAIVIGRQFGAQQLGFYNRAFQLMVLPLNQINAPSSRVALPTLSRLQDQPKRYAEFISFGQTILLNIVCFVLAFAVSQAPDVIHLALGSQWDQTVPLFQILAVAGLFQAAAYSSYWVFLSHGLTTRYLVYMLATRPFVIGIIVLGAAWGVEGVAIAYAVTTALLWPTGTLFLVGKSTAPLLRLFLNALRTITVYGIAAAASWSTSLALPDALPIVRIMAGFLAFVVALALIAGVFPPFRRDVLGIVSARRFFRRSRGASTTAPEESE
jgi:PST family polysaccharide transporter